MRKKLLVAVGIAVFLCLIACFVVGFRTYWYGFNRFTNAYAVEQYLLTTLTINKTTLAEIQTFMKEQIHGGVECDDVQANATALDCRVDGVLLGCERFTWIIHYIFREGILTDVTVEGHPGICL